jgi:septal ring-binding cell division protein DamX
MKKMIVLIMALTFALGITSMVFAAEEKKPVAGPGVPAVPPTLSDEEKTQLSDAKRKATTKPKAVKPAPAPVPAPAPAPAKPAKKAAKKAKKAAKPAKKAAKKAAGKKPAAKKKPPS